MMRKYEIKRHVTEKKRPNQNSVEGCIQELQRRWYCNMFRTVELWDTICSQDHANHGVIYSRTTGKDTVGGTDRWDTRHISIPGFLFLQPSMVQRRFRTWRDQARKIPRILPSHRISHELLDFSSKQNTDVQNNCTTSHKFGITNRTM